MVLLQPGRGPQGHAVGAGSLYIAAPPFHFRGPGPRRGGDLDMIWIWDGAPPSHAVPSEGGWVPHSIRVLDSGHGVAVGKAGARFKVG